MTPVSTKATHLTTYLQIFVLKYVLQAHDNQDTSRWCSTFSIIKYIWRQHPEQLQAASYCWAHQDLFFDHQKKAMKVGRAHSYLQNRLFSLAALSPLVHKACLQSWRSPALLSFDHKFFKVTTLSFWGTGRR